MTTSKQQPPAAYSFDNNNNNDNNRRNVGAAADHPMHTAPPPITASTAAAAAAATPPATTMEDGILDLAELDNLSDFLPDDLLNNSDQWQLEMSDASLSGYQNSISGGGGGGGSTSTSTYPYHSNPNWMQQHRSRSTTPTYGASVPAAPSSSSSSSLHQHHQHYSTLDPTPEESTTPIPSAPSVNPDLTRFMPPPTSSLPLDKDSRSSRNNVVVPIVPSSGSLPNCDDMDELSLQQQASFTFTTATSTTTTSTTATSVYTASTIPVEHPNQNDVLLGRGGKNNQWSGNQALREMARTMSHLYSAAPKRNKPAIAMLLVQKMRALTPSGRYVVVVGELH
jgi:hypothetical protein